MAAIQEGLLYTKDHEWIRVEGDFAFVGLSDFAQSEMGDIVFVEMPEEDDELEAGGELGTVESVKAASDVYSPITGTVVEINEDLEDEPGAINETPYEAWIVKVKMTKKDELEKLMDASAYTAYLEE